MHDRPDGETLELARTHSEAVSQTLPQGECSRVAPTPTEVALVLVRATCCMLRHATPEMKTATPPSNA
jgi:hypothetical protein